GRGDFLWGLGIAIGNLIVLLLSPVIGAIADGSGRKKQFLGATYVTCVVGTLLLYFVTPGQTALGLFLLVVSFVGFSFSENLTAAFLPELSTPENVGRISGLGWGLGYFGGLGCLLLVQPLLAGGFDLANVPRLRLAWLLTGLFFLVAALPTFLFLKERAPRSTRPMGEFVREGFGRLRETARSVGQFSELVRFLSVFFLYSAGLTSVIAFAGIFAVQTLQFTPQQLTLLFLLLQLSSAGGAFVFGLIQDRIGAIRTIQITLALWVLICVGAYLCGDGQTEVLPGITGKQLFWAVGLASGLGIGSLQSASRGLVGLFSPPEKSGEFFGFWGLAGKGAYMIGPLIFGVIATQAGSQRTAMLSTAAFFVVGLIGMGFVSEKRGRAAAEAWHQTRETRERIDAVSA
ncbi:MAG TPA: MFS transporter, partial [Thermoanaerobaculia bacterium]|nr:MFS transporter [Thermoanaerobaculia bacterium]